MNVLVVDPGGTTGFAAWRDGAHSAWALPLGEAMSHFHGAVGSGLIELVVFETIVITGQTLKKSRDVQQAIEFIGVGRYLSRCYGTEFETQTPADAMRFSTDAKIDAMDWACPGPGDHARAASKHLLLALVRHRQIDLRELAKSVE